MLLDQQALLILTAYQLSLLRLELIDWVGGIMNPQAKLSGQSQEDK